MMMFIINRYNLKVRCFNVVCIFIHGNTKISTLIHIGRSTQLLIERFIHNQCHSLEMVGFNVAVKKPEPWIIQHKVDHHILSGGNHHCVFTDSLTIDTEVWFVAPDRFCAQSWVTGLQPSLIAQVTSSHAISLLNCWIKSCSDCMDSSQGVGIYRQSL